jgi:uncharacterized protein (TIGR03000 family)
MSYGNGGQQATPAPSPSSYNVPSSAVRLTIVVPTEAKLFIEDQPTQLRGTRRDFVSPRLTPGQEYLYTLRVEISRNGQKLTKTQQFPVKAGQHAVVEFGMSALDPNELVASVRR